MYTNFTKKIFISVLFLFSILSITYASVLGFTGPGWYAGYLSNGNTQLYGPFATQAECSYQYGDSGYIPCTYYQTGPNNNTQDTTPPVVELVSPTPAEGSTLSIGAQVVLKATATDSSGIQVVNFYISGTGTPVGTDHHSPYTAENWTPSVAGNYTITAIATDEAENTTVSFGRNITVVAGGGQQGTNPSVTLTGPTDGATYPLGQAIVMGAVPSNIPNAAVVFHQNNTPIETDTSSPYSITWTPATTGTYAIKAIASNATGATATSLIKNITVGTTGGNGQTTIPPVTNNNITVENVSIAISGQTATISGKITPANSQSLTLSLYSDAAHTTPVNSYPFTLNNTGSFSVPTSTLASGTYYFTIRVN